jgi:threonyl-tRNA synthetase
VLPITDRVNEYAHEVVRALKAAGLRAEADVRSEKIGAKIRAAQLEKVPYMLVVGDRERDDRTVAVRTRAEGDVGVVAIDEFVRQATELVRTRAVTA